MKKKDAVSASGVDAVVIAGICEFCGQPGQLAATTFHGLYCRDCIEISIAADKEALRSLRKKDAKKENKSEAKEKMDSAYDDLVRGL